ncbi:FadR/GntR family transcriptional regulator [Aestuariicoccus sp. MJ-SS9]|uniref:FadR/GntR family transcriptional regulator n=1 Tax=Aestuariicoccus sp. MJ-SS9 TaxID=3079855 RepID=UPI0029158E13|nr:FCD domain-containing protein [Aestuariicoccus sp. MJ-SS9]MDU8911919.1 FCD domain-containing protein [Aestuariicoccus sp. MJ-SS9]
MNQLDNQYSGNIAVERPADDVDIVERVRGYIDQGDYGPGDRLPPERQLIGELGLPRGALRRALDALEREGVIWRHVGKGTFVSRDSLADAGDWVADLGRQLTPYRMVRARLTIEPAIAREAAMNASAEAMTRMRIALERASAAANWQDYETQDDKFHRSIAEASDNLLLLALFDQLNKVRRAVAWGVVTRDTVRPPQDHSSFAEHEAIADAIERRDPEAAYAAMRAHLRSVSSRLFEEE